MTLGLGTNSLRTKSCEPICADGKLSERSCWPVHISRAHWKPWLNPCGNFMSHGGALCPSRPVQARRFPPSLYSAGSMARTSGARDIQETLKWQRSSSYQQSQSFYPRSWRATPQACPTLNVPELVRPSAARWVRSSKTASASRGPRSAALVVHCQTTSASNSAECTAPLTRGYHDSQALRLLGRGSRAVFWRLNDIRGSASAKGQDKGTA
jgi:hypothetical protein